MVLRPHDWLKDPLPDDAPRSSPPARSVRHSNRRRDTGAPPHKTKASGKGEGSPSTTKPSRSRNSNNGPGGCVTPVRPGRRSRTPESPAPMVVKLPVREFVTGEVTILKRGEGVWPPPPPSDRGEKPVLPAGDGDPDLCSTGRQVPDPEILSKEIRLVDRKPQIYAGSGFFTSPPPSSLPLPTSLFNKKDAASATDLATKGLRYLLRLDLP